MTPDEFVQCFVREKQGLLTAYFDGADTAVAAAINKLGLEPEQLLQMRAILDTVLTDAFYTVLLGLDGEASIGGVQHCYSIRDQDGNLLTGGDIEVAAYEQIQLALAGHPLPVSP